MATTILIIVFFAICLLGFYFTSKQGFGRYATSLVILTVVLCVATLAFFEGKIPDSIFTNLLFLIAGYAGGLIGKQEQ
jgi:hypothetical protein